MNLRRTHLTYPLVLLALASLGAPAAAQDRDHPKRPNLRSEADTNSAMAYYQWGLEHVERSPGRAADAFYWASRIQPSWAPPWYAQWAANLLSNRHMLERYLRRTRRRPSEDILRNDSLYLRALLLDPFLYRGLDEDLLMSYIESQFEREIRRAGVNPVTVDQGELGRQIDLFLNANYSVEWRAWRAYMQRDFPRALTLYAEAVGDSDSEAGLHRQIAHIFYLIGNFEAAQAEMHLALNATRQRDEDELVIVYESKAMLEYGLARVFEQAGQADSAREAYSRALVEDFSFHPAHVQLANWALAVGDTTTGLAELQLAVDIDANDFIPQYHLARVLRAVGQLEEAAARFRRVIELEPFFAQSYVFLGATLEALGDGAGALEQYEEFLACTTRDDRMRPFAEERAETMRYVLGVSQ